MKKSKIYTKTGDMGQTSLVSGTRAPKSDIRIDLYGEVDELNSRIGVSLSFAEETFKEEIKLLHEIQCALFDLGSNLACEAQKRAEYKLPQIPSELILKLEKSIDQMDEKLPTLKNFILPGGSNFAASLHLCRTGARGVERKLLNYYQHTGEALPDNSLQFLNRLSDYFFVLARFANQLKNIVEIEWKPQK
ncbi:MAG: cob(I)yrinic acid a,c-diamide adenosyltransferase [Bacteriovoracaceae bacterium]